MLYYYIDSIIYLKEGCVMERGKFIDVAADEDKHPEWKTLTSRQKPLEERKDDIRSPFARDYTRILHSTAYRRLKHKTQVFFNVGNDHICTRMEHVNHVESVSTTIAQWLGLNVELARAIAIGHDLGHAPFGHQGEQVIKDLARKYLGDNFWHEKNGLRFVDKIELLEDSKGRYSNLALTYAVRDGIISHCGEVDENGLKPRTELIDLDSFETPGQYPPATWEGCVVKIADKIAYLGRDIEDAMTLGFLSKTAHSKLLKMARAYDERAMNTTVIMHNMIVDICQNSSPEKGICMSPSIYKQMVDLRDFNNKYIYKHPRFKPFKKYSELILRQIFNVLYRCYRERRTIYCLKDKLSFAPQLLKTFSEWLARYCTADIVPDEKLQGSKSLKDISHECENEKIYEDLSDRKLYVQSILDFIAGMTDRFAIEVFNELIMYN